MSIQAEGADCLATASGRGGGCRGRSRRTATVRRSRPGTTSTTAHTAAMIPRTSRGWPGSSAASRLLQNGSSRVTAAAPSLAIDATGSPAQRQIGVPPPSTVTVPTNRPIASPRGAEHSETGGGDGGATGPRRWRRKPMWSQGVRRRRVTSHHDEVADRAGDQRRTPCPIIPFGGCPFHLSFHSVGQESFLGVGT